MLIVHYSLISFVHFRAMLSPAFFVHFPGILCRFCLLFRILSGLLRSLARNLIAVFPLPLFLTADSAIRLLLGAIPPSFHSKPFHIFNTISPPLAVVFGSDVLCVSIQCQPVPILWLCLGCTHRKVLNEKERIALRIRSMSAQPTHDGGMFFGMLFPFLS